MPEPNRVPSVEVSAFACPHCGAFTTQQWFKLYARANDDDNRTPNIPCEEIKKEFESSPDIPKDLRPKLIRWCDQIMSGNPLFDLLEQGIYVRTLVENVNISECFNCKKHAIWVHRSMVFPLQRFGPSANPDLPDEVVRDFDEARSILGASPRGAAALLRLAIQKLCAHLGEKGRNIDEDIASLVQKGLDPLVQQSLDIVRVIGNEAVHPGSIDLRDDQTTAAQLFDLVNIIAQQMISHPKSIKAMYERLPEGKRRAIDTRNQKARERSNGDA